MSELLDVVEPGKLALTIHQGSTFEFALDFGDVPLDVFAFRGQIRTEHESPAVLAEFTTNILDNADGDPTILVIYLPPDETSGNPRRPVTSTTSEAYTAGDAYVQRVFEGRVKVTPEVTREATP
jgi:hypothetical protein